MSSFVVTGGAGFIGSHLVHELVKKGHRVKVIDNFSTGSRENLGAVAPFIEVYEGDICNRELVYDVLEGVDFCLHHAAIPAVPRSIIDPVATNKVNIEGTLNIFLAARDRKVQRVIYASSSSVYGNANKYPCKEDDPIAPISPYGVSKVANELYATVFNELFKIELVGFRYFNVFGPRQNPNSQYAAVIPLFITNLLLGKNPIIHGDGTQSRDFTYVDNIVRANLQACFYEKPLSGIFNIACGNSCSVLELAYLIGEILGKPVEPEYTAPRPGDIRKSCADISKAQLTFGYTPIISLRQGLEQTVAWFQNNLG